MAATITGISILLVPFRCHMFSSAYGFYQAKDAPKSAPAHAIAIEMTAIPANFTVVNSADLIPDPKHVPERGSFGVVSKCDWKGTCVAEKKILSVSDQRKFVQEAEMMNNIHHPNCVRLYGVCTSPESLVMEWMGGGDLAQFLVQRTLPKLHRRLSLFRQMCAGLNCLHSHSPNPIIHADLKPANILLDSDQKVAKIADFGLSKIRTESCAGSVSSMVGTLLYCAPEMLLNGAVLHRPTDIYAMGLMLWEMLAGKLVWRNADGSPLQVTQLFGMYVKNERPPLDALSPGLDPAVIALMQDCWANDPAQRPTADELWRRISALDPNNPEHNSPVELYSPDFSATCYSLEDCLCVALPADVFIALLLDMPAINGKFHDIQTQNVVRFYGLSEVEAKCIIMFTHESRFVPDHPRPLKPYDPKRDNQLYFLFKKACRDRDTAAMQRFQNFSFHFMSALSKLPNFHLGPGQNLYRGFGQRLEEMNDLYRDDGFVWWCSSSSSSTDRLTAYTNFAGGSGTLMEITGVCSAKDIRALSMVPHEGEILIRPNSEFKVKLALSCEKARLLNARYAAIPNNVDLVILEAAPPRAPPISASHARGGSSFVLDPAALATLAQLRALQALQAGTAAPGQFFAV